MTLVYIVDTEIARFGCELDSRYIKFVFVLHLPLGSYVYYIRDIKSITIS